MRYYVYLIRDPRNLDPIYVGKGYDDRMFDHWSMMCRGACENPKLYNKLTKIFTSGFIEPVYEILFRSDNEKLAFAMEVFWIFVIGLENLCNLTGGGRQPPSRIGSRMTEETRRKMSNSAKNVSEDLRKKRIENLTKAHSDPEVKKRRYEKLSRTLNIPEIKESRSIAIRLGKAEAKARRQLLCLN
jgi:hypothetical protein